MILGPGRIGIQVAGSNGASTDTATNSARRPSLQADPGELLPADLIARLLLEYDTETHHEAIVTMSPNGMDSLWGTAVTSFGILRHGLIAEARAFAEGRVAALPTVEPLYRMMTLMLVQERDEEGWLGLRFRTYCKRNADRPRRPCHPPDRWLTTSSCRQALGRLGLQCIAPPR